jgi:hypothetical protein
MLDLIAALFCGRKYKGSVNMSLKALEASLVIFGFQIKEKVRYKSASFLYLQGKSSLVIQTNEIGEGILDIEMFTEPREETARKKVVSLYEQEIACRHF